MTILFQCFETREPGSGIVNVRVEGGAEWNGIHFSLTCNRRGSGSTDPIVILVFFDPSGHRYGD